MSEMYTILAKQQDFPWYDIAFHPVVMLRFYSFGVCETKPSLPSLSGSRWPEEVVPVNILCMGQIELNITYIR